MMHIARSAAFFLLLTIVGIVLPITSVGCDDSVDNPVYTYVDNTDFDDTYDCEIINNELFFGKTWLVIGDSISSDGLVEHGYYEYVGDWLDCTVINVAAGGTGYLQSTAQSASWLQRLPTFPDAQGVDFITVMGALNDFTWPLGDSDDTEATTFYGALDLFYSQMKSKYPNIPIGVITSTPRYYRYGNDGNGGTYEFIGYSEDSPFVGYINAVQVVAQRYGLAVLDLYRESGLEPWTCAGNKECFISYELYPDGDGIHPNSKGHFMMAKLIHPFIVENLAK